jgi:phytoene synthase
LTRTQITDEAELIRYAFYVAGTVGLMMSDLLGATDPAAKKFALDLGIAMQLTNILRDVAEDASAGRQYLPQSWLGPSINFFQPNDETGTLARPQFARLHALAQRYYASGYAGMRYLPARSRLAIMIAARLYQEIGLQAARRNFPVLQQRMIISPQRKCWLVGGCLLRFLKESIMPQPLPAHDTDLHSPLKPLLNPL